MEQALATFAHNMVRKGRQSLFHFGLTAVGFTGVLLLLAWFGRPSVPGA